jgi:signal transduction histidine kinase
MTSFLGVPIYQGDRQLGQIYLTNKKNGSEFTSADQQVIETLAAYAAVAISNAQFYRQLTEHDRELAYRNENLALINHMAATLASSTDTGEILENSLSQVMDYLHLDVGEVFLREGESQTLKLVQHRGSQANSMWTQDEFKIGEGVVGETARSGQPVLLNLTNPGGQEIKYGLVNGAFQQVACFPLTGRQGMLGVFCIANCQPQPLEDTEIQFLSAISSWMGTAIENVRLNLQQRRLAVLEERDRIGMDLHDGIIQSIYAVGLTLEHARLLMKDTPEQSYQRIEQAIADLDNTIRDIRAYILDLRPRQLFDENLMLGISRLVHEFRTNTLAEVKLDGPVGDLGLGEPEAVALFHICQEALANAAKHARARRLQVSVWKTADRVLLEINDDGRGFDAEKVRMALGHGLSNMSTRARNVGGDVDISSEPGSGTTVLAWVPLPHE